MRFAVIGCSCGEVRAIETRHARLTCPTCAKTRDFAAFRLLWQGDDAKQAAEATAALRAGTGFTVPGQAPARHDSPIDAAAAQAAGITNRSDRAEAVALWMTRLLGQPTHTDLMDGLQRAGLEPMRAEREITRMLATDYLMEPRAGSYKVIEL